MDDVVRFGMPQMVYRRLLDVKRQMKAQKGYGTVTWADVLIRAAELLEDDLRREEAGR